MVIKINKLARDLKHRSPDLITRPLGRDVYSRITVKMGDMMDHEVLLLDFEGIKVIDSSFIDELIVKLIVDSWASNTLYYVKLKNISTITEINIDSVFRSFSLYNKKNIAVITDDICQNNSFYIGAVGDREKDIIEFLRVNKSATGDDLSQILNVSQSEINGIIENLFKQRLIRKEGSKIQSV